MSNPPVEPNDSSVLDKRLREMEELFMHLERTVRDLDQVIVEQGKQLAALTQKLNGIHELVRSLGSAQGSPPVSLLEEKPPHY